MRKHCGLLPPNAARPSSRAFAAANPICFERPIMSAKVLRKVHSLIRRREKHLALGKTQYEAADGLLAKIIDQVKPGDTFIVDGETFQFVDNFATANTAYKAAGVKRYDIKRIRA